jgi:hypothetical protein
MDAKTRGWISIVGAVLAGYFAYAGNTQWALYLFALMTLISGIHHISKHK